MAFYNDAQEKLACQAGQQIAYIPPTRRQRLSDQRIMLHKQLDIVNAALSALDAHPDLEKFAEALASAGV